MGRRNKNVSIVQHLLSHGQSPYIASMAVLIACLIIFASLVAAKKAELHPVESIRESTRTTEREATHDTVVYSHRKLLQTGVAKTGAPVYRFMECRHLPKQEAKLVQVGIGSNGLPMFRIKRGDYCMFLEMPSPSANIVAAVSSSRLDLKRPMNVAYRMEAPRTPDGMDGGLTRNQQYLCEEFGSACDLALAIQRAENPSGACEIYHYNTSNGTLDWGYFQINSVHLTRPGLNLRDLLDCKANIDYAHRLFLEKGFAPWTSYTSGTYRKFLPAQHVDQLTTIARSLRVFGL